MFNGMIYFIYVPLESLIKRINFLFHSQSHLFYDHVCTGKRAEYEGNFTS